MRRLWAWLLSSRARLAGVLLAFVVGLGSGVPAGNAWFAYTWTDSRFCDDCHIHDYANEAWARSPHAGLTTCHDCHRVPIRHYPRNLWKAAIEGRKTPEEMHRPHIPVVVCEQCHSEKGAEEHLTGPMPDDVRALVVKVDHAPLHQAHLEETWNDEPITCMDCHGGESNRAHKFEATTENCLVCHEDRAIPASSGVAALGCRECHFTGFVGAVTPHR